MSELCGLMLIKQINQFSSLGSAPLGTILISPGLEAHLLPTPLSNFRGCYVAPGLTVKTK